MTERRWRILTALIAVAAALVMTHQVERFRSVGSPGTWQATSPVSLEPSRPRVGDSRWILGPGAHWTREDPVGQWYLRAALHPGAQLVARHGAGGPEVRLSRGQPTVATPIQGHKCDGELPPAGAAPYALVFERTQDGHTFRSGEARIACSAAAMTDARPEIEVEGGRVELVSIGAEEWAAGLPVSPLGWLGGVAIVGFLWMLFLEWTRARGVAWPVVILTELPCIPAAALLWTHPALEVGGVSLSLALVLGSLCLKGLSVAIGGSSFPAYEE